MAEQGPRRRLAAILAADVVGYTRLMEADEEGTLATLRARRREVLQRWPHREGRAQGDVHVSLRDRDAYRVRNFSFLEESLIPRCK